MLKVAACLWYDNIHSQPFSKCYDESWVEKLYRGFKRNLTVPFEFICFTDCLRDFKEPILQERLEAKTPNYGCLIEPFKLEGPLIVCGLDMIVIDRLDHMARYCMEGEKIALPAHPSKPEVTINPIVFVPKGHRRVFANWRGENDMEWLKLQDHIKSDTMWPGQILSYKLHDLRKREHLVARAKIVYFHGKPKPSELPHHWIQQHWC